VTATYYIRNGEVFRAPGLLGLMRCVCVLAPPLILFSGFAGAYPVFQSALVQAATCLQKAIAVLPEKTVFNLATGHQWDFMKEMEEDLKKKRGEGDAEVTTVA